MKEWLSRYLSPSPSLAVALVSLVAATGGTAVAASLITGEQVKDGSLTGADVKDHSLTKADLAGVTAHASRRGRGRRGRRGPRGFKGPAGPAGAPGAAGLTRIASADGPVAFQCSTGGGGCQVALSTATCPAGSFAVGGGFNASTPNNVVAYAKRGVSTYAVIATNYSSTSATLTAQVVCASGAGVSASSRRINRTPAAARRKLEQLRAQLKRGPRHAH